jgi:hypothetical protein
MRCGALGFISFHLMRKHQISQFALQIISHLPQGKYFIFTVILIQGAVIFFLWYNETKAVII